MWVAIQAFCIYFVKGKFAAWDSTMIVNYCDEAGKAEIKKNFTGET